MNILLQLLLTPQKQGVQNPINAIQWLNGIMLFEPIDLNRVVYAPRAYQWANYIVLSKPIKLHNIISI